MTMWECECDECGDVWDSDGDENGPEQNVCPNCGSEKVAIWKSDFGPGEPEKAQEETTS